MSTNVSFSALIEHVGLSIRHSRRLSHAHWLWQLSRPWYDRLLRLVGRHGLERNINGTDQILLVPRFRGVQAIYEPELWAILATEAKRGDIIADVGAYIGLYLIALAKRVGKQGKIYSFEPDPGNFASLAAHVKLNEVSDTVAMVQSAVAAYDGTVQFDNNRFSESHISELITHTTHETRCVCLDTVFSNSRLDILKIDVEGYEEAVLKGARELLANTKRCPRLIVLEAHPYVWASTGTTSESLLGLLDALHYRVMRADGKAVDRILTWGGLIARKE